ncbi:hypothetical protein [Ruegeria sp. HKCCD7559]|uniref:hypothetical protein n=1 Tax=Ruegeria sp. HKCCD7559 TaxID=2683005 RepID=UPI001492E88A|nr:hypothetical protein [Ruegeria sp. HKCCD7559]NOC47708.1 hypothetical protein [Ruegeria sp. HKCCD7559]
MVEKTIRVLEFGEKFRHLASMLYEPGGQLVDPVRKMVRERLLQEVKRSVRVDSAISTVNQKVIADALEMAQSTLSQYKNYSRPAAEIGLLVDVSSLLGIGPTEEELRDLIRQYRLMNSARPVEDMVELFEILSLWRGEGANYQCWVAFSGTAEQIADARQRKLLFPKYDDQKFERDACSDNAEARSSFGLRAAAFKAMFNNQFKNLSFCLLRHKHGMPGFPPRQLNNAHGTGDGHNDIIHFETVALEEEQQIGSREREVAFSSDFKPGELAKRIHGCLSSERPKLFVTPESDIEKSVLYGGRLKREGVGWGSLEHVMAGFAFSREVATKIVRDVRKSQNRFQSLALISSPGCGLSLCLAEVVEALLKDPGINVFWAIDNPDETIKVVRELPEDLSQILRSADRVARGAKRFVFVIDDISHCSPRERNRLAALIHDCKAACEDSPTLSVTFISGLGSDRPDSNYGLLHDDTVHHLKLTQNDQHACYDLTAHVEPKIIEGHEEGLAGLLESKPFASAWEDDPQAFIDYLLRYAQPTREALDHWIAKRVESDQIVLAVARSQMLGLSFQESVAKAYLSDIGETGVETAERISSRSNTLVVRVMDWIGVGLSCAWRARITLESANKLDIDELTAFYSKVVRLSIELHRVGRVRPDDILEYGRHVIQRLSETKNRYWFPGSFDVAQCVVSSILLDIAWHSKDWTAKHNARWAGTLSAVLYKQGRSDISYLVDRVELASVIGHLCERAILVPERSQTVATAADIVPIFKAVSRLYKSGLAPATSEELLKTLLINWKVGDIKSLIANIAEHEVDRPNYRANELVNIYFQVLSSAQMAHSKDLKGEARKEWVYEKRLEMCSWLYEAEACLRSHNFSFDAENWLLISRAAPITRSDRSAEAPSERIASKIDALKRARACVTADPYKQGRWSSKVNRQISIFKKSMPNFSDLLEPNGGLTQ